MNNMRIAPKLWGAFMALLLVTIVVAGLVFHQVSAIGDRTIENLSARQNLVSKALAWKGMTEASVARSMAAAVSTDPAVGVLFKDSLANGAGRIKVLREEITALATTEADLALFKRIGAQAKLLLGASVKASELRAANDMAAAAAWVQSDYLPATRDYLALIDEFVQLQQHKADEVVAASVQDRGVAALWGALGAAVVLAIGMAAAAALVRSIRRPLTESIALAHSIAEGDLTKSMAVTRRDEFGDLMNALVHMNQSLGHLVGEVRGSTDGIATASSQIASGNHDLSARTEKTASSLQQTSASMQQLSEAVTQNSNAAKQADRLAQSASDAAQKGGDIVGQVVETMRSISVSSKRIADITGVIDGIAFQTNILALNAAVEAARAGEQGRGFAVVASEVRSLAQRSAEAAKEIKTLIGASNATVEAGATLVDSAGASMTDIVSSVKRVSDIINEIMTSTNEQSVGIAQVNLTVNDLDQATQQNAALVEQAAAAASSMQDQTAQVSALISRFRLAS